MDNILIPVYILHRDLKVFVIPAYKGNLVIAVFLRQVEQIGQVTRGSLDIIHLHILYGSGVPPNASMSIWPAAYPPALFQWVSVL